MNFSPEFITDFITEYAHSNDVPVPSFDPAEIIDEIYAQFDITNGFTIDSTDDFESLSAYGLALELVASRTCGI